MYQQMRSSSDCHPLARGFRNKTPHILLEKEVCSEVGTYTCYDVKRPAIRSSSRVSSVALLDDFTFSYVSNCCVVLVLLLFVFGFACFWGQMKYTFLTNVVRESVAWGGFRNRLGQGSRFVLLRRKMQPGV